MHIVISTAAEKTDMSIGVVAVHTISHPELLLSIYLFFCFVAARGRRLQNIAYMQVQVVEP